MREIFIGNGTNEYQLHSTSAWIPSTVTHGLEGLESPTMRIEAYNNPGAAGQTISQVLPGAAVISMSGFLRVPHTENQEEALVTYMAERAALLAAITPQRNRLGKAQPLLMRFTDVAGQEFQAEVVHDRYSAPFGVPTVNEWRLQLINPRGIIESQATKMVTITTPMQGGVVFDIVWDVVFGESSGGLATATNAGSAMANPIIRFYGPVANPVLTNAATNEFIALNHELLDGDVITVDTENDTIIQGESTNRMGVRGVGSVLWGIQPGPNPITLTADDHTAGYVEVEWRDASGGL